MMMSPQYDFQQVHPELNEIRSFNFFRMIKPNNPDLVDLQRKLGECGTKRGQSCRLVSVSVHLHPILAKLSLGMILSLLWYLTPC